ncbi:MAG: DUF1232 domain-containing protein [Paludibacteraceae bacterium]|nr:DUF1232 domain-containing protein [Paludibacteraceae bacterium]
MDKKTRHKWNIGIGFVVAIAYILIPTDFVPDVIPVLGWIDDIVAILLAIANAIRLGIKIKKNK